jgi:hypothetical protein
MKRYKTLIISPNHPGGWVKHKQMATTAAQRAKVHKFAHDHEGNVTEYVVSMGERGGN